MHLMGFGKACYDLIHSERLVSELMFGRLSGEISASPAIRIHDLTKDEFLLI